MITPNHAFGTELVSRYRVEYSGPGASSSPGEGYVGTGWTFYDSLTINSTNTPGFHKLKKSQRPFNPYSKYSVRYNDGPVTMVQRYQDDSGLIGVFSYTNFSCYLNGAYGYRYSIPADDAYQKLVAKLQNDIKLGQANLGVTLVEAHKTAAMIAKTAIRLATAMKALRRADLGGFSNALGISVSKSQSRRFHRRRRLVFVDNKKDNRSIVVKKAALEAKKEKFSRDAWLEYTYGWMPLLQDIHSTAKALALVVVNPMNAVRVVRARTIVTSFREREDFLRNVKVTTNMKVTTFGDMTLNYTIPNGVSFGDAMGLYNPLMIAWEVIPFSFVVDWFLPIGNAIEALTAYNGLQFVSGSYQRREIVDEQVKCTPGKSWRAGSVVWGPQDINCSLTLQSVSMTRSFLNSFPSYGWPAFKDPRSVKHMASALALLSSVFRK